jgi:hypothetical protein
MKEASNHREVKPKLIKDPFLHYDTRLYATRYIH